MWKRILGIGAVVLLVAALIGGGAYILLRDGPQGNLHTSRGWQQSAEGNAGGRAGQGAGASRGSSIETEANAGGNRGGRWGQDEIGNGSPDSGGTLTGEPIENWVTVEGTVLAMDEDLVLLAEDGSELAFELGPSWYRQAQKEVLFPGDQVRVTGFYEDEALIAAQIENMDTGQALALRDEAGRPLWAGQGRGRSGQ